MNVAIEEREQAHRDMAMLQLENLKREKELWQSIAWAYQMGHVSLTFSNMEMRHPNPIVKKARR